MVTKAVEFVYVDYILESRRDDDVFNIVCCIIYIQIVHFNHSNKYK